MSYHDAANCNEAMLSLFKHIMSLKLSSSPPSCDETSPQILMSSCFMRINLDTYAYGFKHTLIQATDYKPDFYLTFKGCSLIYMSCTICMISFQICTQIFDIRKALIHVKRTLSDT